MWESINRLIQIVTKISTPPMLVAFVIITIAVLVLVAIMRSKGQSLVRIVVAAVGAIAVLSLVTILAIIYTERSEKFIYRLRVTVLDGRGEPIEDANVWSSSGGEAKKVSGGWEFDIPASERPMDGNVTIYASREAAYTRGHQKINLGPDYHPTLKIDLQHDQSATVRGLVIDRQGSSISGATVFVSGYEKETFITQKGGNFMLSAHASQGQDVLLHVEAPGYAAVTQYHLAGDQPATIYLDRR